MAGDYGSMQARIADELARSDLTSQIKLAILSAITNYQRERFYFNESRSLTFSTVDSQEFYTSSDLASIPNLIDIDEIIFTQNSTNRYPLLRATMEQLDWWSINPTSTTSLPTNFCYYAQQIRLYPIPNGVYTVRIESTVRLTPDPLSLDADTNAWMTDGEEMIRQRAKADINCNVIRDPDCLSEARGFAQMSQSYLSSLEKSAYLALRGETTQRTSSGRIVPMDF